VRKAKWVDGDEEQMERADFMIALALARQIRLYGPHDHEHEWVNVDAQGTIENDENLEEWEREDEMEMSKALFDGACYLDIIDLLKYWNSLVAHGATQNKLRYCIDYLFGKYNKNVSTEFLRKRLGGRLLLSVPIFHRMFKPLHKYFAREKCRMW